MTWKGERQRHSLSARGVKSKRDKTRVGSINVLDNLHKQLIAGKFPITVYPRNVKDWKSSIKQIAEEYEVSEQTVEKWFSKIKIGWRSFIDQFGIDEDAYSEKEWAKDEYRELKREAREDGWLEDVLPFKQWFEEEYGYPPTVKGYFEGLSDEDKFDLANRVLTEIEEDLDTYGQYKW